MKKAVLIGILDWGLGHATRSVPLIRNLQLEGHDITIASSGRALDFLRGYFPELTLIQKPGYNVRYSGRYPMALVIAWQLPKIFLAIAREHSWLRKMIRRQGISEVISDNCYGLWSKNIRSVFITHQLYPECPPGLQWTRPLVSALIGYFINKFDECRVPDADGVNNFSGTLSRNGKMRKNVFFTGIQSRFQNGHASNESIPNDFVFLISGPEPQRTIFERQCADIAKKSGKKCCIVRGLPGNEPALTLPGIASYNHLPDPELKKILLGAESIVCRPGYSTIMDLVALSRGAILVPTPGQTEQEYLAAYNAGEKFQTLSQKDLSLQSLRTAVKNLR